MARGTYRKLRFPCGDCKSASATVPVGKKDDVYIVLNNERNVSKKGRSDFPDDCGVWDASSGTTVNQYFAISADNALRNIFVRDGCYCVRKVVNKKNDIPHSYPTARKCNLCP